VFGKSNNILGNIVCAEVVVDNTSITEKEIRAILTSKLQEFKIPRIIKFISEIQHTRAGKISRK
jgi:acyl-coenzyme A synthetase/AMP-(fatty) acid ligase